MSCPCRITIGTIITRTLVWKIQRRSREKESNDEKRSWRRINESQMKEPEEAYHWFHKTHDLNMHWDSTPQQWLELLQGAESSWLIQAMKAKEETRSELLNWKVKWIFILTLAELWRRFLSRNFSRATSCEFIITCKHTIPSVNDWLWRSFLTMQRSSSNAETEGSGVEQELEARL